MNANKFLSKLGYDVRWTDIPSFGWNVTPPGGHEVFMTLEQMEDLALSMGWEYPKDCNGFYSDRSKNPCAKCGYQPGYMAMYTNGDTSLCANCRPENEVDRHNRRAFTACEAAYLEEPR